MKILFTLSASSIIVLNLFVAIPNNESINSNDQLLAVKPTSTRPKPRKNPGTYRGGGRRELKPLSVTT
jgi:hypothetical protein